jgi:hypothetical protein
VNDAGSSRDANFHYDAQTHDSLGTTGDSQLIGYLPSNYADSKRDFAVKSTRFYLLHASSRAKHVDL